jgi:hypothetical protein
MLGFFALDYNSPCSTAKPHIDYTAQLQSILESSRQILIEVQNHQVTTNIDLTPITSELSQIFGAMNYIAERQDLTTEQVRVSAEVLQKKFNDLAQSIGSFQSATLIAFGTLGDTFKKESDESQALLTQLTSQITEAAKVTEQKYCQYVLLVEASETGAIVTIPANAIEIAAIPYTCYDYKVDNKTYICGHQFIREAKSIGNHILVEDAHEIALPSNAKLHLSYTSLRQIGEPTITGGIISPTDDTALAQAVTQAEMAIAQNTVQM